MAKKELMNLNVVVVNGLVVETQNKSFADNLDMLETARQDGMKAGWKACNAIYNIVTGEQFKEDFKTKEKFADAIGYSKGVITKMVKAWEFKNSDDDLKRIDTVGYEKVYNLSSIPSDDYESFKEFCVISTGKQAWELGDNALRKVLSEYKDTKETGKEDTKEDTKETGKEDTKETGKETLREVKFIAPDGSTLTASISNKDIDTISKILRKGDYTIHDVEGNKIYPQEATPKKK